MKKEKKVNRCGQKSAFKRLVLIVGFLALSLLAASPGWASSLLLIGDAGNTNDTTGYGGVSVTYYISDYEVSNQEYTDFLTAVAATDGDAYSLYHTNMGSSDRGGIDRSGAGTGGDPYVYSVKTDFANRPVNYVSWEDAARYCNWKYSGNTETGAYNTSTWVADHTAGNYWIPTEDEWYKAAYYSGSGATYYDYATQNDTAPTEAIADASGNVSNQNVNVANYNNAFVWNGETGNVSIVGDCGSDSGSHYGTFDQGGNVWEWNEDLYDATKRVRRGGSWNLHAYYLLSSTRDYSSPGGENHDVGFRVASSIPEPSALLLFSPVLPWLFWYTKRKI